MYRVSEGWIKIIHFIGGRIKYSITNPDKRVCKRSSMSKVMGVCSDDSVIPPYSFL